MNGSIASLELRARANPGPGSCPTIAPVIEGIELAAPLRPAFQVGGELTYDFIPNPPPAFGRQRETLALGPVMGE